MSTNEGTELYDGGIVTANMFTFLGVPPVLGRGITPADASPTRPSGVRDGRQDVVEEIQPRPRHPRPDVRAEWRDDHSRRDHASALHEAGGGSLAAGQTGPGQRADEPAVLHVPGEAEAGRDLSTGCRRHGRHRASPRGHLSRQLSEAVHRQRRQLGRQHRRAVQDDALHACGGSRAPAVDCVQQRRQHAARAGHRAREGDGGAGIAGSDTVASGSAAAHRKPAARGGRRHCRVPVRLRRCQGRDPL